MVRKKPGKWFEDENIQRITVGIRYPDEPLRRNYSRLVPDSLSDYRYYIYMIDI